ncbi:DUF1615 domain-containing protein [Ideonella sp. BN130291]|uniref:DUF1615 domain-containing protein n=1 Tax=Ideonella sp. BN130291 TaxID=3112940 RepID=UPI002E268BD1|nr:DUF1615 domain-containing protein [Ideonella sp. BN130291]
MRTTQRAGRPTTHAWAAGVVLTLLLAGCASEQPADTPRPRRPEEVRAQIVQMLPASVADRAGWATDIYAAFSALGITPDAARLCGVLAVTEQESTFRADPTVPQLGKIAWEEIDRRAEKMGIPKLLVHGALQLASRNGKSYSERIDAVKTERELSEIFEDFIDMVPMGKRLFANYNPVHTGGPMQVSVDFAEQHARNKPYPYPVAGSIRHEVFTRRGGLYFGIAHLFDYPAQYDKLVYRFADFNAGQYASRNAAFQNAVSLASGIPLVLDGDLVRHGDDADKPGSTEVAVRALGKQLDLGESAIRRALEQGDSADFERSTLYKRVFELAERIEQRALPRAVMPRITLHSPKITRKLSTEWFATRVDDRHRRCMARAAG